MEVDWKAFVDLYDEVESLKEELALMKQRVYDLENGKKKKCWWK
jgi:hypothetical protein